MFELPEEHRMLQDLVAKFIDRDVIPLEKNVLAREMSGQPSGLAPDEEQHLLNKCKELGLWGLDVPEQYGGANLPYSALVGVYEEQGRTCVPFTFPPDSPNLHMLIAVANDEQRRKYLDPYARGDAHSAIAISEPGAGGDPAGMTTRAVKDGTDWIINGRKIWVSRVPQADFLIVMARTGEGKRADGVTAFIVERGTKGFIIEREIPMLGGQRTYELVFEDCRIPATQLLGRRGQRLRPHATSPHCPPPADRRVVRRHVPPSAGHDGGTHQATRNIRPSPGRPPGHPMVDRRRRGENPCLPPDGLRRGDQGRRREGRPNRGVHGQALRHGNGDRGCRSRHAGFRRYGGCQGTAASTHGTKGPDDACLRGALRGAPHGDCPPHHRQMTEPRIKAGIWVSMALRMGNADGRFGVVVRKGDPDAGGILVVLRNDKAVSVLSQLRSGEGRTRLDASHRPRTGR